MKTKVTAFRALLSIAGIFPVFAFSQEGGYTIKGSIDPSYVGKIYLVDEVNHKYVPIDSTDVSQGTYVFKGPLSPIHAWPSSCPTPIMSAEAVLYF